MIFLLIAAALVAGAPLIAAVLVSVASIYEDAVKSLAGRPPGLLAAAARRLLQARVGGAGPLQHPHRPTEPTTDGRQPGQPERATQPGPIPVPPWVADDESATGSHGVLATPRG